MDDLATRMRAAAESPPPTRIDLDVLISGELRRRRTLRWASGAAAAAAVVTLAIAAPGILARGPAGGGLADMGTGGLGTTEAARPCRTATAPGPQQSHDGRRPTEPCGKALERLAAELSAALRLHVVRASASGTTTIGPVEFAYVPVRLRYEAQVYVSGASGNGFLRIELIASHEHPDRGHAGCPARSCRYETDPDGTIVVANTIGQQFQVAVYRPDGTALLVMAYPASKEANARSPLTLAQVMAVARTPGLTLYP